MGQEKGEKFMSYRYLRARGPRQREITPEQVGQLEGVTQAKNLRIPDSCD
jgi:hypothetical protein